MIDPVSDPLGAMVSTLLPIGIWFFLFMMVCVLISLLLEALLRRGWPWTCVPEGWRYVVEKWGAANCEVWAPGWHVNLRWSKRVAYKVKTVDVVEVGPVLGCREDGVSVVAEVRVCIEVVDVEKAVYEVADFRRAVGEVVRLAAGAALMRLNGEITSEAANFVSAEVGRNSEAVVASWGLTIKEVEVKL